MPRYCTVCGQKSGRCNHLIVDLAERKQSKDENIVDKKKLEKQE